MSNSEKNINTCGGLTLEVIGEIPECSTKIYTPPIETIYADLNGNAFNNNGDFMGKLRKDVDGKFVFTHGGNILPEHEKEFNEAVKSFKQMKKQEKK